jgi:hypothetical protein
VGVDHQNILWNKEWHCWTMVEIFTLWWWTMACHVNHSTNLVGLAYEGMEYNIWWMKYYICFQLYFNFKTCFTIVLKLCCKYIVTSFQLYWKIVKPLLKFVTFITLPCFGHPKWVANYLTVSKIGQHTHLDLRSLLMLLQWFLKIQHKVHMALLCKIYVRYR